MNDTPALRAVRLGEVGSTMDVARELGRLIEAAGSVASAMGNRPVAVFAERQRAGRGRRGRRWTTSADQGWAEQQSAESDAQAAVRCLELLLSARDAAHDGALSFVQAAKGDGFSRRADLPPLSILFPRALVAIPPEWLSLAVGCAVYDAVEDLSAFLSSAVPDGCFLPLLCPKRLYLKWPNDLIALAPEAPGRAAAQRAGKLAGILAEASLGSGPYTKGGWFVVGLGVNLLTAPDGGTFVSSSGVQPLSVAAALANVFLGDGDVDARQQRRRLERWLVDADHRTMAIERFAEAFEREIIEYICVPRTVGQLRSLALSRMVPYGWTMEVSEGGGSGTFAGLGDDGALLLEGRPPIYAGDVALVQEPKASAPSARSGFAALSPGGQGGLAQDPLASIVRSVGPGELAVLTVDIGNTRLHWGYGQPSRFAEADYGHIGDGVLLGPARTALGDEDVRDLLRALQAERRSVVSATVMSVRDSVTTRQLVAALQSVIELAYPEIRLEIALVCVEKLRILSPELDDLIRHYGTTMGVDRAVRLDLALREAKRKQRAVAVLSLGTATTLEVVGPSPGAGTADGVVLLDSRILPGVQMAFDALARGTALLPRLDYRELTAADLERADGRGTVVSLVRGIILGIADSLSTLCLHHHVDKVWICGGSAAHFLQLRALVGLPAGCTVELSENLGLMALAALRPSVAEVHGAPVSSSDPKFQAEGRPFRPLLGHDLAAAVGRAGVEDTAVRDDWGQAARRLAGSLFRGRRHYRKLAAAGRNRTAGADDEPGDSADPDRVTADGLEIPPLEDFRRLGPRVETTGAGERLDRHLGQRFRFHSRSDWQSRIARNEVLVEHCASRQRDEGQPMDLVTVKATYRLMPFDQLWLYQPREYEPDYVGEVDVLRDTGDAIAFHKPGNLVVHATGLYGRNTFLDVLAEMGRTNVFPVHRIDRETSGILLCAREAATRRRLAELFRDGVMRKMYIAMARSFVDTPQSLLIDAPIGPAIGSPIRLKMWIGDRDGTQEAQTHVVRLARVGDYALYACFPLTGRTNQIRVHLAAAGQWILGDKMYHPNENVFLNYFEHGLSDAVLRACEIPRQALHNAAMGSDPEVDPVFRDGPLICPLSSDLLEMRIVRDLLEEARLGLSPASQAASLRKLFLDHDVVVDLLARGESRAALTRGVTLWGVADLEGPSERARTMCASVIGAP